jgi:salicylate hydroxylase
MSYLKVLKIIQKIIFLRIELIKQKWLILDQNLISLLFHLSNPLTKFFRNVLLKRLVKNKKFLESYLGKIYKRLTIIYQSLS